MDTATRSAIDKLLARRAAIQAEYDRLIAVPASYGITGSVSATNRGLRELRAELVAIDAKIAGLVSRTTVAGLSPRWPDYRHDPFGGVE